MKEKLKRIYRCDYCNKLYFKKLFCLNHEERCKGNPKNFRVCNRCPYLEKVEAMHYVDTYVGGEDHKVNVFYCEKLDVYVYPFSVERKKNWFEFDNKNNIPMKKECVHYDKFVNYREL